MSPACHTRRVMSLVGRPGTQGLDSHRRDLVSLDLGLQNWKTQPYKLKVTMLEVFCSSGGNPRSQRRRLGESLAIIAVCVNVYPPGNVVSAVLSLVHVLVCAVLFVYVDQYRLYLYCFEYLTVPFVCMSVMLFVCEYSAFCTLLFAVFISLYSVFVCIMRCPSAPPHGPSRHQLR